MALALPSTAWAGPGEWDYVGSSSFYTKDGGHYSYNGKSHGGKVKACIYTTLKGKAQYGLYEYDPGANNDDKVGTVRTQVDGGCEVWDVGGFVDGDNNTAELYISTNDWGAYTVKWYD